MSTALSLPIINITYHTYKDIYSLNKKMEKSSRYSIGVDTEKAILDLVDILLMASYSSKSLKAAYLVKAQSRLDGLRLRLRLYLELSLANETKIFQIQAKLDEAGRMLGGWRKSVL